MSPWAIGDEQKSAGGEQDMGSAPEMSRVEDPDQPRDLPDEGSVEPLPGEVCLDDRRCERCVVFSPELLDFGTVPSGQRRVERFEVSNCSARTSLYIRGFGLDQTDRFEMNAWTIGDAPFALAAGDSAFVEIEYNARGRGRAQATFELDVSESPRGDDVTGLELEILGESASEPAGNQCPVARATGQPANGSLPPQKVFDRLPAGKLLLDGRLSYDRDEDDFVAEYRWSLVEAPPDARVEIESASSRSASTILLTPGDYLFKLSVFDRWGRESCMQSEVRVNIAG